MQDVVDMAEAHGWTLQRLREMAGRLTEQAYQKACAAGLGDEATDPDPDAQARWMLVFDRMARGLRLTLALEAKLARERRADAARIAESAAKSEAATTARAAEPRDRDDEPRERDREADDDGLPGDAPLTQRIARLKALVEGAAEAAPAPVRFRFEDPPHEAERAHPLPLDGGGAGVGVEPLRARPTALGSAPTALGSPDALPPPPSPALPPSRGKGGDWRGSG